MMIQEICRSGFDPQYVCIFFKPSGHDCRGAKFGLRDVGSEVNVLGPVAFVVAHVFGLDKLTTTACCDDDVFCSSGHTIFPMVVC